MSWRLQEFACDCGLRCESLERPDSIPDWVPCSCGGRAERAISAVKSKTVWGAAASTGKSDVPDRYDLDTRQLADRRLQTGQWRQQRRTFHRDERRKALGL